MSKKTQTKKYAGGANKKVMKDKKIVITVSENGELQMDLTRITNDFELLGILLTAVDNAKYFIQENQ
jgi:hypothetical protein